LIFSASEDATETVQWYSYAAGNTVEENSGVFSLIKCASCCQQNHAGSKTLLQQSPAVLKGQIPLAPVPCNFLVANVMRKLPTGHEEVGEVANKSARKLRGTGPRGIWP